MKTSSPPDAPDRASARAWTLTNLLVLPGLGSLAAGRRVGWVQVALAVTGLGAFLYGVGRLLRDWLAAGGEPTFAVTPAVKWLLAGLGLSAMSWVWALITSLQVHRAVWEAERIARAPGVPPRLRGDTPGGSGTRAHGAAVEEPPH